MNNNLRRLKDKLYYYFAEKNWGVSREYPEIKEKCDREGNRLEKWKKLICLNVHYRVFRKNSRLYIEDRLNEKMQKLPYLDGAESELSKRRPPIYFAKDLLQYDVVSFDIFDTLILRPFAKPADLFMIVGKRLNRVEFHRIRTEAEKKAREIATLTKGNHEVTIYDIYALIEERTGIPKALGVRTELEVELQYCFANPYMKRVFRLLQEQDKPIIIVSDMYLPHDLMEQLLSNAGYTGYEKLYVSCDYDCSKRSGSLYQYVKRDYANKKIVHVGDNIVSDIQSAEKVGLDTRYYKNVHEIGAPYRADGMSELVGSAYAGIVNTHLHNGFHTYSPQYEYGFIYGGLYVLGFCNWIHQKAKQEGIDKVLFLSRDGAIYQRVFNMLFDDVPNEYFLWSRIANTKYTLLKNREDFLKRVIKYRANGAITVTVAALLDSLSLTFLKKKLQQYNLSENDIVVPELVSALENLFVANWDDICKSFSKEKDYVKQYLISKIGSAKRIAFIDVGWLGSGPMGLKYLIEDEFEMDCEVKCWQSASRSPKANDVSNILMDGTIEIYMFSQMLNRNHYDTHAKTNKGMNNIFKGLCLFVQQA